MHFNGEYYRDDIDGLSFISRALAQTANTVIGAGAFVFDPNYDADNDHHSNMEIQKGKMNLKVGCLCWSTYVIV